MSVTFFLVGSLEISYRSGSHLVGVGLLEYNPVCS